MSILPRPTLLHRALVADALISGATGLLLLAAGGLAAPLTGLPPGLLRGAGVILLPFAALVLWLARQPAPTPAAVKAVIAANLAWVIASLLLLVAGSLTPTLLGYWLVIGCGLVVGVFAELQVIGLRRNAAPDAPLEAARLR